MSDIKNLPLSMTILTASIILGGFYYASESNKQKSIERQQEIKIAEERRLEEKKDKERAEEIETRNFCMRYAGDVAAKQYKEYCTSHPSFCPDYKEGVYLVKQYDAEYVVCLESNGLK